MDHLIGTSKKSPALQGLSCRCRQRNKPYFSSHLLGHGDRGRLRTATAAGRRRHEDAAGSQTEGVCSILPGQTPRPLSLIETSATREVELCSDFNDALAATRACLACGIQSALQHLPVVC